LREVRVINRLNTYLAVSLLAISMLRGGLAQNAPQAAGSEIKMTAKKYEFDPNVITVKNGEHVKLVITALDHDHGFKLEAFKIDEKLKKGTPTTIEFTADKVGTFPFECSHFCGVGHGKMKGKLVVPEH
jgi:cytochrome c oxidase subunit II